MVTAGYSKPDPDETKIEGEIDFVKTINEKHHDSNKNFYPRFHIKLVVPLQISQLEITSFHIDRRQHKARIDYSRKNDEVGRLIKILEKEGSNAIRD